MLEEIFDYAVSWDRGERENIRGTCYLGPTSGWLLIAIRQERFANLHRYDEVWNELKRISFISYRLIHHANWKSFE